MRTQIFDYKNIAVQKGFLKIKILSVKYLMKDIIISIFIFLKKLTQSSNLIKNLKIYIKIISNSKIYFLIKIFIYLLLVFKFIIIIFKLLNYFNINTYSVDTYFKIFINLILKQLVNYNFFYLYFFLVYILLEHKSNLDIIFNYIKIKISKNIYIIQPILNKINYIAIIIINPIKNLLRLIRYSQISYNLYVVFESINEGTPVFMLIVNMLDQIIYDTNLDEILITNPVQWQVENKNLIKTVLLKTELTKIDLSLKIINYTDLALIREKEYEILRAELESAGCLMDPLSAKLSKLPLYDSEYTPQELQVIHCEVFLEFIPYNNFFVDLNQLEREEVFKLLCKIYGRDYNNFSNMLHNLALLTDGSKESVENIIRSTFEKITYQEYSVILSKQAFFRKHPFLSNKINEDPMALSKSIVELNPKYPLINDDDIDQ